VSKVFYCDSVYMFNEPQTVIDTAYILKSDHDRKVKLLEAALEKCREQRNIIAKLVSPCQSAWNGDLEALDNQLYAILNPKPSGVEVQK
jgi:hypothetical protein